MKRRKREEKKWKEREKSKRLGLGRGGGLFVVGLDRIKNYGLRLKGQENPRTLVAR